MFVQMQNKMNEMGVMIQELTMENQVLKNKNEYLDNKIRQIIQDMIQVKKENKKLAMINASK
jgi:hypothetical protein